ERATHEVEVLHADHQGEAVELAVTELDGVSGAGLVARVLEPVGIAALVAELQGIDRYRGNRDVEPGFSVENRFHARRGAHTHLAASSGREFYHNIGICEPPIRPLAAVLRALLRQGS